VNTRPFTFTHPLKFVKVRLLLGLFCLFSGQAVAQSDSMAVFFQPVKEVNKTKLKVLGIGTGLAYGSFLAAASQAWYKDMPRTRFHFFNDNQQWQQVDKVGHFWGAFHQGRLATGALRWAGVTDKKAILWGSLAGVILQTPIEILDGYAVDYGASTGDMVANALGSVAVLTQYLAWPELRIQPKYSFHTTRFARERPTVLGSNLPEQMLKDYNGQTYWLAVEVGHLLPPTSRFPQWLNVAVGYGTEEMVYNDPDTNKQAGFRAYRQFYLAPDLNLSAIKTRSKFLKTAFFILDMVHVPAPTLEFNKRQKFKFYLLYF